MQIVNLKIDGMSCQHCVARVKKALEGVAGVTNVEVSIGSAKANIDESVTNSDNLISQLEKIKYKAFVM